MRYLPLFYKSVTDEGFGVNFSESYINKLSVV